MAPSARQMATAAALDAFGEDDHVEIIDGDLVQEAMTSFEHGDAQVSHAGELKAYFRGSGPPGGDGGRWIASEVDVEYSPTQVFRHDASGWRKARVPGRPTGKRVTTRPDWVLRDPVHQSKQGHGPEAPRVPRIRRAALLDRRLR